MDLSKTFKLLIICLFFIAGIASTLLNLNFAYFIIFFFIALYFLYKKIITYKFALICMLILLFSIFYTNYRTPKPDSLFNLAPAKVDLRGRIISEPNNTQYAYGKNNKITVTKFELEVSAFKTNQTKDSAWILTKAKTLVSVSNKQGKIPDIAIGDIIETEANIKIPYKACNPGQFDYKKYLKNSGIFTLAYIKNQPLKLIEHPEFGKWFFLQKLNKIKNKIISIHRKNLKSPELEILGGIVFGDHAIPTPKNIKDIFINSGLLHLLAASGMNVSFIFGFWFFFARKLLLPHRLSIIIGIILVGIYSLLTGLPPSVTRAAGMLEFILFGKLIDRKADNVTLLALICMIMLLFDPLVMTDIGFQLSFIVTFGLLICMPIFTDKLKPIPNMLSGSILLPVVAQMWVMPIQMFHFNTFAAYSVIANILVLPFTGIISFLGFAGSIFSLIPIIGEKICWLSDKLVEPLIYLLLYISKFISTLPASIHYFPTPNILFILVFYAFILVLTLHIKLNFSKKRLNWVFLALILSLFLTSCKIQFSKELKFIFFAVGEADSILIQTPNKKNILVDTAGIQKNYYNSAKSVIIPYLRDVGINKLDAIILTHPDSDHIGGTVDLIKNIHIDQILDNGDESDSKTYKQIKKFIKINNIPNKHLKNNEKIYLDKDIEIQVIKPQNTDFSTNNEDSIILYIKYGSFSALLMGDGEADALNLIKKTVNSPVDLLKVGHHGSFNSVNKDFIEYLKPKTAVISVGENKYFHPNPCVLDILKKYNIKTFRTDRDCAVEIKTIPIMK
ncbi:MAG: DNA internalization-related competence protein ComEC/Rec2 [bacterium]